MGFRHSFLAECYHKLDHTWTKRAFCLWAWLFLGTSPVVTAAPGDAIPQFNAVLQPFQDVYRILPQPGGGVITADQFGAELTRFDPVGRRDETYGTSWPEDFALDPVTTGLEGQILGFWKPNGSEVGAVVRLTAAGQIDGAFKVDLVPGEYVISLDVQTDGKLLVWSAYTVTLAHVHWERIRRFNSNGSLDESFNEVRPLSLCAGLRQLPNGQVLLTGAIGVGDLSERAIVRLHADGRLDTSFGAGGGIGKGCVGSVIPVAANGLLAIDEFANFGEPFLGLTRFRSDGSRDFQFQPMAIDGAVSFVGEQQDGKVIIAGNFKHIQGSSRPLVARLKRDGSLDAGFALTIPAFRVDAAALDGNQLLVSGIFNSKPFLVRLEGQDWASGPPAIAIQPVSGVKRVGEDASFEVTMRATPTPHYQWLRNGQALPGETNSYLMIRNLQYGHSGTYQLRAENWLGMTMSEPAHLLVNPPPGNAGAVDLSFDPGDGVKSVNAIDFQGDKILIAGSFTTYNGSPVSNIARLHPDGSLDTTFLSSGANNLVSQLAVDSELRVYAGGTFSAVNGRARALLVRLNPDGTTDGTFRLPIWEPDGNVSGLLLEPEGKVLVAGRLNSIECVVRLNSDGSFDRTWNVEWLPLRVRAIGKLKDGRLLVGGSVSTADVSAKLLCLKTDGTIDSTYPVFSASRWVDCLFPLNDGRMLVGLNWTVAVPPFRLASYVALTPAGQVDTNFPTSTRMDGAHAFARLDDKSFLVAGGGSFLGRCSIEGVMDPTFSPRVDQGVFAIAVQRDGRILVAGAFTRVNNLTRRGLARLFAHPQTPEPLIQGPFIAENGFEFSIPTTSNRVFRLEAKGSLGAAEWVPVTSVSGNGQWQSIKDPDPGGTQRFYRIRVE